MSGRLAGAALAEGGKSDIFVDHLIHTEDAGWTSVPALNPRALSPSEGSRRGAWYR